ncbi:ADP-heptose:LPS heptosyltransferase [Desulfobaculum xiamenense]|uniref:ADP-heptose:LPS heptosyltransferase n=1 Tax=Desulfobaculum xiamenense TaxID=995050 RepID=A0A846QFT7_9BACT|nr:glycosyltransferase family 9 protein [Desulfobaculum xiamenense]NJB67101.1 ADP-heptose:LPS heptosyltransferase [Desulfobaculum xiamenense]
MGDFLCAWPAIRSIALHYAPQSIIHAGKSEHAEWLAPLGIAKPGMALADAVMRLHAGHNTLPTPTRILRFGLETPQTAMPVDHHTEFIPGIDPVGHIHVREAYLRAIADLGIAPRHDWAEAFRELFATNECSPAEKLHALVFPGAGHPAKRWSLVKFFELGKRIKHFGLEPIFVLGPAEREQGLDAAGFRSVTPSTPGELHALMRTARVVIGNDCGPMHLAGMLGLPGVALFGPVPRHTWAPAHPVRSLAATIPCRPCTLTTRHIPCRHEAPCMQALDVENVWREFLDVLNETPKFRTP